MVAELKKGWVEIRPASDLVANLKFLEGEAIECARRLRAQRNLMQLNPMDLIKNTAREFFNRVDEKTDLLGQIRRNRILRHRALEVYGLDPSVADNPQLEPAITWFDGVTENIEYELDAIERRRILWTTVAAAVAAAIAAGLSFATILFDFIKTAFLRS